MPAELLAAVAASVAAKVRRSRRRRVMRYATICGVVVAIGVAVGTLAGGGEARASLLEALKNQAEAKSVIRTNTFVDDKPAPGAPAKRVTKFYGEGAKSRAESDSCIAVTDGTKTVSLDAVKKVATTILPAPGEKLTPDFVKLMAANVKQVLESPAGKDKVVKVPAVEIGGKSRPGYKVVGFEHLGRKLDITYWLDAERQLPLRSEMKCDGPTPWTSTSDYVYGEALDPKLFSIDIPEGYTRQAVILGAPGGKP